MRLVHPAEVCLFAQVAEAALHTPCMAPTVLDCHVSVLSYA